MIVIPLPVQIFRCLQTELTSEFLLEVLRRLMDHVCDMDDSQTVTKLTYTSVIIQDTRPGQLAVGIG